MVARIRKSLDENQKGFTLVELLVVVIIIGILAAIAIPAYLGQQNRAKERALESDLVNAKTALIAWQVENPTAQAWPTASWDPTDFAPSADVNLTIQNSTSPANGTLCIFGTHDGLPGTTVRSVTFESGVRNGGC